MSVKRRDNKKRILRDRESQCKDGRYRYTFYDANGKQKCIYSWKLESTDKLPAGKRDCIALRDQIAELNRFLDQGGSSQSRDITVLQLVEVHYT